MARIIKITGYLVDPCDGNELDAEAVKDLLSSRFDLIGKNFKTEECNIGEWDDDHELNYCNSPIELCEKYFT